MSIAGIVAAGKYRGKGYASALTCAVTRKILETSRNQHCALFTDSGNPTSNGIYRKLGYQDICELQTYDFKSV